MPRHDTIAILTELGRRLGERGMPGDMYLTGGEAMAMAYDAWRITRGIDAVLVPQSDIYQEAQSLADGSGSPRRG